MFSKYTYKPSSTLANVYADIIAIITGETNVANLSASCDQPNTSILNTTASGWVANGTNWNISQANPLTQTTATRTGTFGSGTISNNDIFYSPTQNKYYDFGSWSTLSPAGLVQLSYSTDASTNLTPVTYSLNSPSTSSIVNKISCMGDNGAYVVWLISGGTTNYAYYSANGTTFASTTAINADWRSITSLGSTFVAVASGVGGGLGGTVSATSTDNGVTWNSVAIPIGNYQAVISNGTIAVAVGNNCCATFDGTTWTSSVTLKTDIVNFGTASGNFIGSNNPITIPDSNLFVLTADFTIEFFIYVTTTNPNYIILGSDYTGATINNQIQINQNNSNTIGIYNGSWYSSNSTVSISANTWHYIALSRIGTNLYIYYDGNQLGTTITNVTGTFNFRNGAIGALKGYNSQFFIGRMDALQIVNYGKYNTSTIPLTPDYIQ
ncbi:MAG: hypothetical protein PHC28_07900 [Flavobacterium sp.]|uniref:LamG-like jellyroll fold domain-containing protein n=1 Tax=Flavobacterium sp. TaxID=239 RepID=UPI002624E6CD|nr:LamG-like jellyroll fold domain-containing protein [Flavobacterium sp.]MDD5150395.1 hypothetical protein [Flavobacterium sp.]